MKAFAALFAAFLVAGVFCTGYSSAQTVNASLGGTVTDASGAVVPGASVVATGIETGVASKTITNETGAFQFISLQAGNYRVTAEMTGFQKVTFDPVVLNAGANMRVNFKLPVAGASTTLEVTAAAESPLLATTAVVSGLLTGKQILDLPLIDRDATNLALTQAALAGGIGTGVNVAGGNTQSLMTTLNGINISNTRLNRAGGLDSFQFSQSVDMVEEVKVVTSPADVELGRALGQVQMIVRSGTNEFHGSLVNGVRNTAFNANTFWNNFSGLPRQDLKRNQFAGRIGGPIIKNKAFFFFLYDGNRQRTSSSSNQTVLTEQARQGLFRFFPGVQNGNIQSTVPTVDASGNPVKPAAATGDLQTVSIFGKDPNRMAADTTGIVTKYLGMTPAANNYLIGDGLNTAGYQWQVPAFTNRDQFTGKVDYNISNNNHLNVVLTYERQSYLSTAPMYPNTQDWKGVSEVRTWYSSVGLTTTFRPTLLNEFRAGLQHPNIDQVGGTRAYPEAYPSNNGWLYTPGFSTFTSPIPGNIDASLVNPVYSVANSLSWIRGTHSFKWGFSFNAMSSNSWNINNGFVPNITFGAGSVAVQGISAIPGIGQNRTLAQNLLTDLNGSVASAGQGFGVLDGKDPHYQSYPGRRFWKQRDLSFFFKDDFKLAPNFTLNYGIRWDYVGVPFDGWGRTPYPTVGFGGMFGISGTDFTALWTPGPAKQPLMAIETVGPNSMNEDKQIYKDYYKAFAPALGFSWSLPYFGKDKTVLRMGYGWTRPRAQSFLGIDGSVSTFGNTSSYNPTTVINVNQVTLPLLPSSSDPLAVQQLTDRSQSFSGYDPFFMPSIIQNWNVSLERQLTKTMTVTARYVGNMTTHLVSGTQLNAANIFENGIADAFKVTQSGGNAPLFDQLFMGLNLGLGVVNGTTVTGSASARQYSATSGYLNGNNVGAFAAWLNTTNSFTNVRGGLLTRAGLPTNTVMVNPQYTGVSIVNATARSSYNAAIIEFQKRFSQGWIFNTNFTWAKTLLQGGGGDGSNTYRNPRNTSLDKAVAGYDQNWAWKANGTYSMPLGPGRKYLNSKAGFEGIMGMILGGWQLSGILNTASGTPLSITGIGGGFTNGGTSTASLVGDLPSDLAKLTRVTNGVVYFPTLTQVTDPQVANLTTQQNLQSSSTMKAIASDGKVFLQNAASGTVGTLAIRTNLRGPGTFTLDMNMGKTFRIKERYSVEFRVDAISVTNTTKFDNPTNSINSTSFGRITAFASNGGNQFTMPSIFNGNRVLVLNLRVNF
jgi:hypothetical protein